MQYVLTMKVGTPETHDSKKDKVATEKAAKTEK